MVRMVRGEEELLPAVNQMGFGEGECKGPEVSGREEGLAWEGEDPKE